VCTYSDEATKDAKYDMVFIIGPDHPDIALLKNAAAASNLRICIIGDGGKESFLDKKLLAETLSGKIDANTSIHINGHGTATKNYKNGVYSKHEIKIYKDELQYAAASNNQRTSLLLEHLQGIFNKDSANKRIQPVIELWSCHGGAAANNAPDGLKLTLHSGQKYSILLSMNSEAMVNAIKAKYAKNTEPGGRGKIDPYDSFMKYIVSSPETAIYTENGQFFKATAPKEPLAGKELEKYLRTQLKKFLEFRRDKLGHGMKDSYIDQKVVDFRISSDELARYNELALIMESCRANSKNGLKYVNSYINKKVEINSTLLNGTTALYMACYNGNLEVVRLFIERGANVNQPNNDGFTPLDIAREKGHTEVAKLLLAERVVDSSIFMAKDNTISEMPERFKTYTPNMMLGYAKRENQRRSKLNKNSGVAAANK